LGIIEKAADALEAMMAHGRLPDSFNHSGKGELFILKYLADRDSPVLPSELSEAMQSSAPRISAALGTLERKGYIHREIDLSNRRKVLVTITDAGRDRTCTFGGHMRRYVISVLTEMGEEDAAEFVRLVKKFYEIVQRNMPDMDMFSHDHHHRRRK